MPKYRLLVIEDDRHMVDMVRRVAKKAGFDMRSVCNFTKIMSAYDAFVPHVIVLDIFMPNMDGFEVLNFLHRRGSSARIVIISGQEAYRLMAMRMAQALNLTIVTALAKPFRIAELEQALQVTKLLLPARKHSSPIKRPEYA